MRLCWKMPLADNHPGRPAPGCDSDAAYRAIVAGFGIPGRAIANLLETRGIPFCVIELNPETVRRCSAAKLPIIQGDVTDEQVLRRAGIEKAELLALAVPDDKAALAATSLARRLNPAIHIVVRCRRVSASFEAHRRGADHVVAEEQVVAEAMAKIVEPMLPVTSPPADGPPRG